MRPECARVSRDVTSRFLPCACIAQRFPLSSRNWTAKTSVAFWFTVWVQCVARDNLSNVSTIAPASNPQSMLLWLVRVQVSIHLVSMTKRTNGTQPRQHPSNTPHTGRRCPACTRVQPQRLRVRIVLLRLHLPRSSSSFLHLHLLLLPFFLVPRLFFPLPLLCGLACLKRDALCGSCFGGTPHRLLLAHLAQFPHPLCFFCGLEQRRCLALGGPKPPPPSSCNPIPSTSTCPPLSPPCFASSFFLFYVIALCLRSSPCGLPLCVSIC